MNGTIDVEEEDGDEQPQISQISTICKDCIFAEWHGDTQTGCEFDRLDAFEENGAEIVGQDDGQLQYFVVSGRFCNACRNHNWGSKHPQSQWRDLVEKEFRVRCDMLIYISDDSTYQEVFRSIETVLDQTLPAWGIRLIVNRPFADVRQYVKMMRELDPQIPWEVRHVKEQENVEGEKYHASLGESVDLTVIYVKATYYTLCRAGYSYPLNYIETLERAVNRNMTRFVALLPDDDGNGLCVQTILHNTLRGHKVKDVIEKIEEIASEESTGHMIKRFEDL
jgi:hypothetical protein